MSHIFISYAHTDKAHLDNLVTWLRENGFAERKIWYDKDIQSGNNWRDEIATALDEAFAVLAIVTTNSMNSRYCVFEWGYTIGQDIPLLPLAFDNLSITDVFPPLTSKQFTNCTDNIPAYLKEQIEQLKSVPPQVAAINKAVYEAIYDTHRRFFILGWLGDGFKALDQEFGENVIADFSKKASEAHRALEILITEKAFAFSGKQYRYCWKLMDFLKEFSRLPHKVEGHLQNRLFPQFDASWLPAFEYFEGNGRWSEWIRCYFEDEIDEIEVFAEMVRAFPLFNASDADILIHNAAIDRKRKPTQG